MKNKINSRFTHRLLSRLTLPVAPKVAALLVSPRLIAQPAHSRFRKLVAVAFSSLLLAALLAFVMTAAADKNSATPSSPAGGSCVGIDVTNTADGGAGSLRQAIIDANAIAGLNTICFNIPAAGVQTITPLSALPPITSPVIIDGYSQPGSSANTLAVGSDATLLIELNGTSAGAGVNGLTISAGGSTVRGLVINRFSNVGIALATSGANTIQGNYIGTNAAGTANLNNANVGVFVSGTPDNLIGGTAPAARNVLTGNSYGVFMTAAGATGNMVQGNYIGLDISGAVALGNTNDGVLLQGSGSNTIGGTDSGAGNVISGNGQDGVSLFGANSNTVRGNLIGTDATGTLDRGNVRYGVIIRSGSTGSTIGGNLTGAGNVISGNDVDGINISESSNNNMLQGNYIGTNAAGTADLGNTQSGIRLDGPVANTTIGGPSASERNVISGNNQFGVDLFAGTITGTTIQGNFIGTNAAGNAALGNSTSGIRIRAGGTSTLTIGGTTATTPLGACTGACNLISGNTASGIEQSAAGGAPVIQGNYIGTDVSGTIDLGNASIGIDLNSNAVGNTIGGMIPAARNVISGNNGIGVNLAGGGGHTLLGNYIGLNSAGTAALGNSASGVLIGSGNNTVGGTAAGAGNVISGHNNGASPAGVQINTSNNTVQGNFIGTNAAGTAALGNRTGIFIANNSTGALIGGATTGAGNVISGNTTDGIFIGRNGPGFTTSNNNTVQGNFIGTTADGTADLGNASNGVVLRDSNGNTIGGATAGERNVISGNNASGVRIDRQDTGSTGNMVRGNYIGTNSTGTGALGNSTSGVFIDNSSTNTVGGTVAGQSNVIAFNTGDGVFVNSGSGNAVRANSIFGNNELGIDLSPNGVTPNDANDTDTGANNLQNFPVLTDVTTGGGNANILGTLDTALANTAFTLEFFSSDSCNAATPNDFGEGQTPIHTATVTTDASGDAIFNQTFASSLSGGKFVTATATDPSGNTSEFSQCRQAQQVTISIGDATVIEGNSGQTNASFAVNTSRTRGVDVVVSYTTADNTATDADNDYEPTSGSVTITAGNTSAVINVPVNGDNKFELNDTFFVNITATNADLADAQGVGTITNDDSQPTITIGNVSANEGNAGSASFDFNVSLSNPSYQTITVNFQTADNTATDADNDYEPRSGSVTITENSTSGVAGVTVNGDNKFELNDAFFVNLSGETNATVADGQGVGTILNDDTQPTITISDVTANEGNAGTNSSDFNVSLSNPSYQTITVNFQTADNTATDADNDYEAAAGLVTITENNTSGVASVTVNGDNKFELNDAFFVNLSGETNATVADSQGVGTITNDDSQPTITVSDVSANEGNAGSTSFDFSVSLSNPSYQTITVNFQTADNTATDADNDYEAAAGPVTITENNTSGVVSVTVNGDSKFELTETFFVDLSGATNASIADAQGAGTIANDDSPPSITISDISDSEGNTGTKNFTFTVNLSAQSGVQASVTYSTADGNAQAGSDYASASGPLTFAPGETSKPVVVQVSGDTDNEVNENFFINLSGESGATLADSQGQGAILNDDGPTAAPALISGQITLAEGTPLGGVVVTLTGGQVLRRAITDAQGNYLFTNVDTDGFYIVTPARANYFFSPAERSFPLLANKTDAVFSASPTAESGNPLDTPEFFVRQNYLDFLGREPDQEGLDYWTAQIRACVSDQQCMNSKRVGVSAAFYIEQEFQDTGNFVHRVYVASLGRKPRYEEFIADRSRIGLGSQVTAEQTSFMEAWVARDAFRQMYPLTLSAADFVNQLFDSADLQPYATERQQQIDAMLAGKTRAQVLRDVIELPGFKQREFNAAFVLMEYFGFLRREPDPQGYEFWLGVLNNRDPNNYRGMVCSFITSAEYQQRFSAIVTHTNAECGP